MRLQDGLVNITGGRRPNGAATAQAILWVEPGTYQASLALIAIRERLRDRRVTEPHFRVVAGRLRATRREGDGLALLGGDECAIIVPIRWEQRRIAAVLKK